MNKNYFNWLKSMTDKCGLNITQQIQSCFLHTKLYYNNLNTTEASPSNYLFPSSLNKIIGYKSPNILVSILDYCEFIVNTYQNLLFTYSMKFILLTY
jgi:hypothetical protein